MQYTKRLLLITVVVVAVLALVPKNLVFGATTDNTTPGQALQIAPPLIDVSGNPGQTISVQMYLQNISSGALVVTNQINNFTAKGETGVPEILFKNTTNDPYSILGYITPLPTLVLQPQQLEKFPVYIAIPKGASPGGHYGVIRFTGTPASISGKSGVSLSASLGALVLLTVNGHIVENLQTHSFTVSQNNGSPSSFFQNDPLTFTEVLKNTGNEHVIPHGIITIKDMFGHTAMQMNINEEQGNVLPGTLREFTEEIDKTTAGNKRFFGRYSASFNLAYGTPTKHVTGSLTFWVIPIDLIAIWLVVLIGGFFLIRYLIKRYNQHIVQKAQSTKKK